MLYSNNLQPSFIKAFHLEDGLLNKKLFANLLVNGAIKLMKGKATLHNPVAV